MSYGSKTSPSVDLHIARSMDNPSLWGRVEKLCSRAVGQVGEHRGKRRCGSRRRGGDCRADELLSAVNPAGTSPFLIT